MLYTYLYLQFGDTLVAVVVDKVSKNINYRFNNNIILFFRKEILNFQLQHPLTLLLDICTVYNGLSFYVLIII